MSNAAMRHGFRRTKIAMMADAMIPVTRVPMKPPIACPMGVFIAALAETV